MELETYSANANYSTDFSGVYNLGHFLSMPLQRPKPALAGVLFEGHVVIMVGYYGGGKTLFATQMGLSLASGTPFLGKDVPRPYKVDYIDCENGMVELQDRIKKQLKGMDLTPDTRALAEANFNYINAVDRGMALAHMVIKKQKTSELEETLRKNESEIVIIDNLGSATPGDIESPIDIKAFLDVVADIKRSCQTIQTIIFLQLQVAQPTYSYDGDGQLLRVGIQAYSLGIAYEFDPYFGLSISRVDPLPHQLEVYDYLLKLRGCVSCSPMTPEQAKPSWPPY
ncbi:MAG TPA: AAA family ATPase [Terriglobales bacterium]|nr:AAA family ATPase [Terriglobales bacterium]